jgi:hypothetical protein
MERPEKRDLHARMPSAGAPPFEPDLDIITYAKRAGNATTERRDLPGHEDRRSR